MSASPTHSERPGAGIAPNLREPIPPEETVAPENKSLVKHPTNRAARWRIVGRLVEALTGQAESLKTAVEGLTKAVEAFKGGPSRPTR